MKVNEIINEGPLWDKVRAGAVNAAAALGHEPSKKARDFANAQVKAPPAQAPGAVAMSNIAAQLTKNTQPAVPQKPGVAVHKAQPNNPNATATTAATQNWTTSPGANSANDAIVPRPGMKIVVTNPDNKGIYYKTKRGWTDQYNHPITKPQSIAFLDKLADGAGKEIPE